MSSSDDSDVESDASEPIHPNMRHRRSSDVAEGFYFNCGRCKAPGNSNWPGFNAEQKLCRNCATAITDMYDFVEQAPARRARKQAEEKEAAMELDKSTQSTAPTPRRRLKRRSELDKSEVNDGTEEPGMRDENDSYTPSYNPMRSRRYSNESDTSVVVVAVRGPVTEYKPDGQPYPAPNLPKRAADESSTNGGTVPILDDARIDGDPMLELEQYRDDGAETVVEPDPSTTGLPQDQIAEEVERTIDSTEDVTDATIIPNESGEGSMAAPATKKRSLKEQARQRIEQEMGVVFLAKLHHAEDAGYDLWKTVRQLVLLPQASKLGPDSLIKALVKAQHDVHLSRKPSMSQPSSARLTVSAVEKAMQWVKKNDRSFLTYEVDTVSLAAKGWGVDAFGFIVDPGSAYDKTASRQESEVSDPKPHVLAAKTPIWGMQRFGAGMPGPENDHMQPPSPEAQSASRGLRPLLPKDSSVRASQASKTGAGQFIAPPAPPQASFVPLPVMNHGSPVYGTQPYLQMQVPYGQTIDTTPIQPPGHPRAASQDLIPAGAPQVKATQDVTPTLELQQVNVMANLQKMYAFHKSMMAQHQLGANIVQGVMAVVRQVTKDKEDELAKTTELQQQVAELRKDNETLQKRTHELEADVENKRRKLNKAESKLAMVNEAMRLAQEESD